MKSKKLLDNVPLILSGVRSQTDKRLQRYDDFSKFQSLANIYRTKPNPALVMKSKKLRANVPFLLSGVTSQTDKRLWSYSVSYKTYRVK